MNATLTSRNTHHSPTPSLSLSLSLPLPLPPSSSPSPSPSPSLLTWYIQLYSCTVYFTIILSSTAIVTVITLLNVIYSKRIVHWMHVVFLIWWNCEAIFAISPSFLPRDSIPSHCTRHNAVNGDVGGRLGTDGGPWDTHINWSYSSTTWLRREREGRERER